MATPEKQHDSLLNLEHKDGQLIWGGADLPSIVATVDSTPFYVYSRSLMTRRVESLRAHMPADLSIHYAMKANPMPDVVNHMTSIVDGLDVASGGELAVALDSGMNPGMISFAGPGKRDEELRFAIDSGITINVESSNELNRICDIATEISMNPEIALRVNPAFELKTSGMKMGGMASQFGIDSEQIPAVLSSLRELPVIFRGFHVYGGSQNLRVDAIENSIQRTVDLVIELAANAPCKPNYVNLGGGLGIPYFRGESSLDLAMLEAPVTEATRRLRAAFGDIEIIMELGRYLVGEAGIYVTRVVDLKDSRGKRFAICDGGLNHHLAASGNFGQILRKDYPIVIGNRMDETLAETCTIVGPLCTPLDLLGNDLMLPEVEIGDLVVIMQSGAYGYSASPTAFLSHPTPAQLVL